jgi:hypothetical protein
MSVVRAVAQQAEPHYRQTPFVYYNQRRPVLRSQQVAELVHDVVTRNYVTNYEVADNLPEIDKAIKHKAFLTEWG